MIEAALRRTGGVLATDVIRRLVPQGVAVGLRRDDGGQPVDVMAVELDLLGPRATAERRRQFALGRAAAHAALASLPAVPAPVGRGPRGEPLWPAGIVGAIAHTENVGVAIVGSAAELAGLGVDVELASREVQDAAARLVCTPAERAWADEPSDPGERRLRRLAIFSGKEAIFKALYPVECVYLGFSDAELTWRTQPTGFVGTLRKSAGRAFPAGMSLEVRCALVGELLVATVAVPRTSR